MTPIPVEVQQSDLTEVLKIAIPAVAAVIVGFIAAVTAGRRQQRALAAERERLQDQLAHERGLHDLDGLRELLDDASALMLEAVDAHSDLMKAVRGQSGKLSGVAFDEAGKALESGRKVQSAYTVLAGRMLVHFEVDDPLFVALNSHLDVFERGMLFYLSGPPPPVESLWPTLSDLMKEAGGYAQAFNAEARMRVAYLHPQATERG